MITNLGKELRKIRIDREERLMDMAGKLGCSAAFISAVELGHKTAPASLVEKVIKIYKLSVAQAATLRQARASSIDTFKISAISPLARDTAALLARRFTGLPKEKLMRIRGMLEEEEEEVTGGRGISRAS